MESVKIAELRNRLSEFLRAVEKGAEVVVTDRDRPIARIVPVRTPGRQIRIRPPKHAFAAVRDKHYPPANWKTNSTELLLQERQQR